MSLNIRLKLLVFTTICALQLIKRKMNLICYFGFFNLLKLINASDNFDKFIFPDLPLGITGSSNKMCSAENRFFLDSLENSTLWAQQMWDASAKSTTGVLQGNSFQMGNFDECMKVEAPFKTQFCFATITAKVPVPENITDPYSLYHPPIESVLIKLHKTVEDSSQFPRHTVHVGMCIPASCSRNDLETDLNSYLFNLKNKFVEQNVTYSVMVMEKLCQSEGSRRSLDGYDISFCVVTAIFVLCAVSSSIYDFWTKKEKLNQDEIVPVSRKIFLAFSVKRNFKNLLYKDESNPSLHVFHGIKVFSICMIIIDHRLALSVGAGMNIDYVEEVYRSWISAYFYHGGLFVDTFFTLSGILLCYGLLIQLEKKSVNPGFLIILRYIRLTPVYAFVVFLYATVLYHLDSGPIWELLAGSEVEDCRLNWWTNLLYINNYVNSPNNCMLQSWYLPCDFHFFIIGIFLVLLINRNKTLGLGLLLFLSIISLIIPFTVTMIYSYPAVLPFIDCILGGVKSYPAFYEFYIKSHNRATPYFVGILTGYIYYKWKNSDKKLQKITSHCITIGSIFLLIFPMAIGTFLYNPYHKYNSIESGSYAALHRLSWSIGTVGLFVTSSYGWNKNLRDALSWNGFVPLGKLVYGTYLIQLVVQIRDVASSANPIRMSYLSLIVATVSDIVVSFAAATLLYLLIENPVRKIAKELFFARNPTNGVRQRKQTVSRL